jgi:AcrR family transcriptional regulator
MVARMSSSRRQAVRLPPGPQGLKRSEVEQAQRERLLAAMTHVASTVGYEEATVERVLAEAGVSRRTFYELFDDREDCFVAAYDDAMRRVLRVVTDVYLDCEAPERRLECALETLLELCAADPDCARMCVVEVFAAGPRTRERRAEAMDRLAHLAQHALGELRGDDRLDQLSAQALVGAVHELIFPPIDRRDTASLPAMASDIMATQIVPLVAVER